MNSNMTAQALVLGLALCGVPGLAYAGPLDLYGFGGQDSGQANTFVARGNGPAAVLYNVGALSEAKPTLEIGLVSAFPSLKILIAQRPDGYDIPDLGSDSTALPSSKLGAASDTDGVSALYGFSLGAVTSLGVEPLRLGATLFLPARSVLQMNTHYVDERERYGSNKLYFELIDGRLRRLDLQMGASWRFSRWLSLGAGAMVAPTASLNNDVTLKDAANQEDAEINLRADTGAGLGWTIGGLLKLGDHVNLGASWRSELAVRLTGENRIRVLGAGEDGGAQEVVQVLSFVPSYSPARAAFGFGWQDGDMSADVDVKWTRWSRYVDTHGQRAGFEDTIALSLGGRWQWRSDLALLGGVGFEPSPVPEQRGRTNYVDNDRVLASLGASHRIDWSRAKLKLDWAFQLHALLERTTQKERLSVYLVCSPQEQRLCDEVPDDTADPRSGRVYPEAQGLQTGNPGFPGFSSGGWIGALSVRLSWEDP